jgi:hypothetical protein
VAMRRRVIVLRRPVPAVTGWVVLSEGRGEAAPQMKAPSPLGEGESRPRFRKDQLLVQRRTAIMWRIVALNVRDMSPPAPRFVVVK